jgi:hypothetical protein
MLERTVFSSYQIYRAGPPISSIEAAVGSFGATVSFSVFRSSLQQVLRPQILRSQASAELGNGGFESTNE